jgi:hypothetical protein
MQSFGGRFGIALNSPYLSSFTRPELGRCGAPHHIVGKLVEFTDILVSLAILSYTL